MEKTSWKRGVKRFMSEDERYGEEEQQLGSRTWRAAMACNTGMAGGPSESAGV